MQRNGAKGFRSGGIRLLRRNGPSPGIIPTAQWSVLEQPQLRLGPFQQLLGAGHFLGGYAHGAGRLG